MNYSPYNSQALYHQSGCYPKMWAGRVPLRVRMLTTVTADYPLNTLIQDSAVEGQEYEVAVNSHGAVSAILPGSLLGLKPSEFEIVAWHEQNDDMAAEAWNKAHPVGTPVRYYPIQGDSHYEVTHTSTPAWNLGSGHAVVSVHGHTGGMFLSHLVVIDGEQASAVTSQEDLLSRALDCLMDVIGQACGVDDGQLLDSMALSAYADGIKLLAEYQRLVIVEQAGRRVIARRIA